MSIFHRGSIQRRLIVFGFWRMTASVDWPIIPLGILERPQWTFLLVQRRIIPVVQSSVSSINPALFANFIIDFLDSVLTSHIRSPWQPPTFSRSIHSLSVKGSTQNLHELVKEEVFETAIFTNSLVATSFVLPCFITLRTCHDQWQHLSKRLWST